MTGHFTFPRTMTKGIFKDQYFETQKEYQDALKNIPHKREAQRRVGKATFSLEVTLVDGTRYSVAADAQSDVGLVEALQKHMQVLFPRNGG